MGVLVSPEVYIFVRLFFWGELKPGRGRLLYVQVRCSVVVEVVYLRSTVHVPRRLCMETWVQTYVQYGVH